MAQSPEATREELVEVKERLRLALARIEEREKQREPPECVKANGKQRPAEEQKPRKKREARYHQGRSRGLPTHIVEHHIVTCPPCHCRLGGIRLVELPRFWGVPECGNSGEDVHQK
jgi:hypothetical protein